VAQQVILEFADVDEKMYDAVNQELGLDPNTGTGDWPAGLLTHTGGPTADGGFVVVEIWESQAANETWMGGRLGAALGKVGIPAPVRVTWSEVRGRYSA